MRCGGGGDFFVGVWDMGLDGDEASMYASTLSLLLLLLKTRASASCHVGMGGIVLVPAWSGVAVGDVVHGDSEVESTHSSSLLLLKSRASATCHDGNGGILLVFT